MMLYYVHPRANSYVHVAAISDLFDGICAYRRRPMHFLKLVMKRIINKNVSVVFGANYSPSNFVALVILSLSKSPLILHFSEVEGSRLFVKYIKYLISSRGSDSISFAFTTKTIMVQFGQIYAISLGSIRSSVVWHSTEVLENYNAFPATESTCRKYHFVFFGRLQDERGYKEFVRLAELLPEFHFVIAGKGDGESFVLEHSHILENLDYLGYLSSPEQKFNLLSNCYVLVSLMKNTENFGISIIEALHCGCEIVCPKDIGPVEILGEDYPGFYSKGDDMKHVASLCLSVLNNDEKASRGLTLSDYGLDRFTRINIRSRWKCLLPDFYSELIQ